MTPEAKALLVVLENYLTNNPQVRFCQALVNLGIVETNQKTADGMDLGTKDPYYDEDAAVLERLKVT